MNMIVHFFLLPGPAMGMVDHFKPCSHSIHRLNRSWSIISIIHMSPNSFCNQIKQIIMGSLKQIVMVSFFHFPFTLLWMSIRLVIWIHHGIIVFMLDLSLSVTFNFSKQPWSMSGFKTFLSECLSLADWLRIWPRPGVTLLEPQW